jgi:Flp pilus assembly protein TadG
MPRILKGMETLIPSGKHLWRCELGAEFVEFALTFPLLMLVLMGILDFGLMFQQYEVLTNAAREGARIAVVPGYSDTDVVNRVTNYVSAGYLSMGGAVTVDTPLVRTSTSIGGAKCVTVVSVTVHYTHNYLFVAGIFNYFGGSWPTSKPLSATANMRSQEAAIGC